MPDETDDTHAEPIRLDLLLASLRHPARRSILLTLAAENPGEEDDFTIPDFDAGDEDFELFRAKVRYEHLPRLERAGLIEWDREADTVTRGPDFEEVRPLVTLVRDHRDELPDDWI